MRSRKRFVIIVTGALALLSFGASAQEISSSINAYSPYTMYGLGDLSAPGNAVTRAMGGAGVGYRSPYMINNLNPASMGAIGQRSFLFNFGMEGQDFYLKSKDQKTLHNTFNIREVSVSFPLAKNLGFAFSVTPFSSVGYKVETLETDQDIIANLGQVKYRHLGAGDISQIKAGLGTNINRKLFLGAEAILLKGSIDRYFTTQVTPINVNGHIVNVTGNDNTNISRVFVNFGAIYNLLSTERKDLSLGATYRVGSKLNADIKRVIPSNNIVSETAIGHNYVSEMFLPSNLTVGLSYNTTKIGLNADYTFQNWGDKNSDLNTEQMSYTNTNAFKAGFLYIPQAGDVRNYWRRVSYRVGVRVEDYYMKMAGHKLVDKALTLGLGFPVKSGYSNINFGFEIGQRGTTDFNMIKENYIRFSVEFNLFGEDDWFRKFKIN